MRFVVVLFAVSAVALAGGSNGAPQALGPIWADHDTGNVKMSITAHGGIGFTAPDSQGSGFRFPKTMSTSRLYYCGMLCGNDPTYIADRFYGNPAPNLNKDFAIADSLHRDNWYGGQEYSATMNDSRHATPKGLDVRLHTIALPVPYGNGVVIIYDYWNNGGSPLNGMYAAIWADFDISSGGTSDIAYTDSARRLAAIRQSTTENPNCGVVVLSPHQSSNVSVVFHPTWVYPTDTCVTESQKFRWLSGVLHQDSSATVNDHSVLTATGPFDLPVGGGQRVAFAMMAGTTRAELIHKLDSLQAWFDLNVPVGIDDQKSLAPLPTILDIAPNPTSGPARIRFGALGSGSAQLNLYDRQGRLVSRVWSGQLSGRTIDLPWTSNGLENGIYFLRLEGAGLDRTLKTVVTR